MADVLEWPCCFQDFKLLFSFVSFLSANTLCILVASVHDCIWHFLRVR